MKSSEQLFENAQKLLNKFRRVGISPLLDPIKLVSVLPGDIVCRLVVEDIYLNANGMFHGGLAAVVADVVTFLAASTLVDDFHGTSVEMSVRFLKALKKGDEIHIIVEAARAGKRIFVCKADFIDGDGNLAIRGDQTIYMPTGSTVPEKATNTQLSAKL